MEQFNKEVVSFGRQPDNDIILDLDFISRIHGVFFMEDGTWYVQDLDSTNGLLVNGTYIDQQYAIKEGDCICIQRKDGEESISINIGEAEQAKTGKIKSKKKLVVILSVVCVLLVACIVSLIVYAKHRDSSKRILQHRRMLQQKLRRKRSPKNLQLHQRQRRKRQQKKQKKYLKILDFPMGNCSIQHLFFKWSRCMGDRFVH